MIGITERGDAALNLDWLAWTRSGSPAILISKDPQKLCEILAREVNEGHPTDVIVHATITGMGGSIMEPGVPLPVEAMHGYRNLVRLLGVDHVVLRIDPIIPNTEGIVIAERIRESAITRVRISFLDLYPHVLQRFAAAGITPPWEGMHAPLEWRQEAAMLLGPVEICGEPGFTCTGCVSEQDCQVLGIAPRYANGSQRPACTCTANKRELLGSKGQCSHLCRFCYWK